ncbi:MAG: hypothetical protein OES10_10660 [Gammaproteobacteria bacterium]|nr:hypothetical protein [Gammaproteobacteria bacterium]MDH3749784.1 hypothetical protein [Gammaproteobacteria bacterium]
MVDSVVRDFRHIDPDTIIAKFARDTFMEERDVSNEFRNLILAGITLLFVAGCGSSGGNDGNPNPPVTGELVTITSDNATTVAGIVAQQVLEDNLFGALTTTGLPVMSAGSGAAIALSSLSAVPLPADMLAAQSTLQNCADEGTVDVTVSISNPPTISRGDEFAFQFDTCDDGTGTVLHGRLVMTITAFEGDPTGELFLLGMSMKLSAFQVTQDGNVTSATGTISVEIDSTMPPITTITVSTTALTTTHNGVTEYMSSMTITVTTNDGTTPASVDVDTSFRISSPRLGGDVIVSTSISMQSSGEGYPFMGELVIEAADNTAIVFIALDNNMVRLEIDINGDDVPDEVLDVTWVDLLAAADAA